MEVDPDQREWLYREEQEKLKWKKKLASKGSGRSHGPTGLYPQGSGHSGRASNSHWRTTIWLLAIFAFGLVVLFVMITSGDLDRLIDGIR